MKKKIITLVIAFLIMFHIFSLTACDKSEGVWGYRLLDDGDVAITSIRDLEAALDERGFLTIPTELEVSVLVERIERRFGQDKFVYERVMRNVSQVGDYKPIGISAGGVRFYVGETTIERIIIPQGTTTRNFWSRLNAKSIEFLSNEIDWSAVINGILYTPTISSFLIIVPDDDSKKAFFKYLSEFWIDGAEEILERMEVVEKSEIDK